MPNATIYLDTPTMERLITKIESRLSDPGFKSNPHKGKNRNELRSLVQDKIAIDVSKYLTSTNGNQNGISYYAFTFGEILDDTVYILTPASNVSGNVVESSFNVDKLEQSSCKFSVDFYHTI